MKKLIGAALLMATSVTAALAEAPVVSGYVETNWGYNAERPMSRTTDLRFYYDDMDRDINSNAHLAFIGKLGDQAGYTVEIDAGNEAALTSADDDFDIQEAYLTYVSASKLG